MPQLYYHPSKAAVIRMGFSLTVGSQITQQGLARHLGMQAHSWLIRLVSAGRLSPSTITWSALAQTPPLDSLTVDQLRIRSYANPLDNGAYI